MAAYSSLFLTAFMMSILAAAQPGIITFEAIRRGAVRGFRGAFYVEVGSLIGDAVWSLAALTGAALLFQNQTIALGLSVFGCYLLLRLAWEAWLASHHEVLPTEAAQSARGDFAAGALLSLSNPSNLTFWLGMSGTIIGLGFLDPEPSHLLTFFAGFMIAQVCWCFFMAALVTWGRQYLTPRRFRWVNLACAVCLALFGVQLLIQTSQAVIGFIGL